MWFKIHFLTFGNILQSIEFISISLFIYYFFMICFSTFISLNPFLYIFLIVCVCVGVLLFY